MGAHMIFVESLAPGEMEDIVKHELWWEEVLVKVKWIQ